MGREKDIEWIDVDGLAMKLAEEAWNQETREMPDEKLYEQMVSEGGEVTRQVVAQWHSQYWMLVTAYKSLIMTFVQDK